MTTCACASRNAFECYRIRYNVRRDVGGNIPEEHEGLDCECDCHRALCQECGDADCEGNCEEG